MEHVTSDLKLIDRLWNDPTYGLDGFSTEGGYIQPIDRDQAVDENGHANYDGYVLSLDVLPVLKHRDSSTYRVEVLHVMVEAFFPR